MCGGQALGLRGCQARRGGRGDLGHVAAAQAAHMRAVQVDAQRGREDRDVVVALAEEQVLAIGRAAQQLELLGGVGQAQRVAVGIQEPLRPRQAVVADVLRDA